MNFVEFMAFCAFLTQSHTTSTTVDSNTDTELTFTEGNHNSAKYGYGYEPPKIQFNYPNEESNTHTNYAALETNNYLDQQAADSQLESVTGVPERLLLKIPKLYVDKFCKHEKDLRPLEEERDQRRPPPRRLVPYMEVVTHTL